MHTNHKLSIPSTLHFHVYWGQYDSQLRSNTLVDPVFHADSISVSLAASFATILKITKHIRSHFVTDGRYGRKIRRHIAYEGGFIFKATMFGTPAPAEMDSS